MKYILRLLLWCCPFVPKISPPCHIGLLFIPGAVDGAQSLVHFRQGLYHMLYPEPITLD